MNVSQKKFPINNESISYITTRPDEPTNRAVLLIHGGPGGTKEGPSDLFILLSSSLASAGIASIRFDMLGAGDSTGDYADMTLADQASQVKALHKYLSTEFNDLGVLGESLGAASLLCALPLHIKAAVLLWPAIDLVDTALSTYLTPEYEGQLSSQGYLIDDDIRVGKAFIEEFQRISDLYDRLKFLDVPTLLIHGDADSEVPHSQSQRAIQQLGNSNQNELVIVPGGDHCLREPEEQNLVVHKVTSWFENKLV